ncbi:unnamed protein product [Microthlaspi erraticum]|uniref:Arabidopsis retrotransposon Orf1 C-terminal domain-containing protein n=1 Tax=Microthlaspi erraticum TaxID=1685480 RepID=A0A6D2J3F0_9BRAS|nr:unnamed protein product [Microthlaspi erraticum]
MDTQTLDLLKIRDDVTWYIRKLGLSKLFKLECSEYSQLTKEFLSTVALAFPNHNGDQPAGDGLLLFKIGDANGRISISALCQLFGLPNETAHDFKENSKRKQAAFADWTHFANEPFLPSRSKVSRITHPAIRYVHRLISTTFQCKQEANKTFINVRKLAKDLEGNKKLCVRFGRLITAIVHVGIDIPNYEPLPKPTPLDLHALQHIHFLNRWTKDPTRFCYEFPIGPANTSLVLLPHETSQAYAQELSLSSPMRKTSMFHQVRNHHSPCSHIAHFSMQSRLNAATKNAMFSLLAWPHQALDRVNKLEKIVECQSRFISRLVPRLYRESAPNRADRLAEKRVHARPNHIRPSEVSAKVQTVGRSRITTRETCPRSATPQPSRQPRTTMPREPGKSLAAAQPVSRTTADAPSEPGNYVPRPAEKHRPNLHRPTTRPTANPVRPRPFRSRPMTRSVRPIVPTDRPNAAVDPKPVLKPVSYFQGPA